MSDRMGRSYTVRIDGASAPYHGDPRFTEVPVRRIDERTLEETNLRGGKVVQVARWRVHPNGRTMHVRFDDTRGHVMEQTGRKLPRGNAMTRRRRKPPVPDQAALPPASGRTTSVPHRPHRRGVGPMVSLLPMEQHVWEAWRIASIATYAAEMVRVGAWAPDSAEERAVSEFARIVPNGRQTAGHEFRSIVAPAGEVVGALWFAPDELGRGTAFIWDIAIERAHRGEGYGRAAMEALEPLARSLGYDSIRLHVVGDNAVARSLYESVGYSEADVTMVKHIG
jgi:ribosomal protein S18 acetylase RimI-like enzyme